jgi:hypothetical protein
VTARVALSVAIVVVLAAGVVAVAVHDDGERPSPEQARLEVDGVASVTAPDGTSRPVADGAEVVDFGDRIVMEDGTAVLALAGGATYELRHRDGVGTELEVGTGPRVTAGDLLVVDGFPAQVMVDTVTLSAEGALRVDADETVASAYVGRSRVTGVGDVTELPGLRRLALVAGAAPAPLDYDGSDPWDRRFLGEAIAFGERLEALARGYTGDLPPGSGRSADFFQSVIPALAEEREFGPELLDPARPPGETLVGAAIAVQGRRGTFRERWVQVFDFRAAGAAWGLVALDQGVSSAPVLDTIEVAIATSGDAASSSPTTTVGVRPEPTTTTTTTTTTTSGGGPPTTGTTTTTTAPPPDPGLLDPVLEPVTEILGGLLDLLGLGEP